MIFSRPVSNMKELRAVRMLCYDYIAVKRWNVAQYAAHIQYKCRNAGQFLAENPNNSMYVSTIQLNIQSHRLYNIIRDIIRIGGLLKNFDITAYTTLKYSRLYLGLLIIDCIIVDLIHSEHLKMSPASGFYHLRLRFHMLAHYISCASSLLNEIKVFGSRLTWVSTRDSRALRDWPTKPDTFKYLQWNNSNNSDWHAFYFWSI